MTRILAHISHYLLISITLAFMAGILLQHYLSGSISIPVLIVICLFFFALTLHCHRADNIQFFLLFLTLLVTGLGYFHAENQEIQKNKETTLFSKITQQEDAVITGTLHRMPAFDGEQTTLILNSEFLRLRHEQLFSPVKGLVQLRLKGSWPEKYLPGDSLVIRARLSRPYSFANPGSFNYPRFLDQHNIRVTGRISSTANISLLQVQKDDLNTLSTLPERIRLLIKVQIDKTLPPLEAALYRALLIGDRSGLTRSQIESFKAAGVFHILAISGLHLSLVASMIFIIFYWIARRSSYLMLRISCRKMALIATIPFLIAYTLLAGAQTPVLRALVMVVVFIISFCIQRQKSPFTTLSLAALIILFINPKILFSVSFQLSFAAVAALISIIPNIQDLVKQRDGDTKKTNHILTASRRWIGTAILISIAATICTAPLLILSFNRISTVGVVANLIIEPLLCFWSLPLGLFASGAHSLSPVFAEFLLKIGSFGIQAAMTITDFLAGFQFSSIWLPTPSTLLIVLYYLTLLWLLSSSFSRKSLFCFFLVCFFFLVPPRSFLNIFSTGSELVFLDVGQGSSTFITLPGGKTVLIDGGGSFSRKFNIGESVIAPYLWYRGLRRLDHIIITHPDSDHSNGIPFILQHFRPNTLWINGNSGNTMAYDQILQLAATLKIPVRQPAGGQVLVEEKGVSLTNLKNPFQNVQDVFLTERKTGSNDESLIIKFSDSRETTLSCLLPGDISKRVEKELMQSIDKQDLKSMVLLSPHHGSKTSNSTIFLQHIGPQQIIVSAGRFRPHIFPSPQLRSYCIKQGITLLNTAETGTITISTDKGTIKTSTFREKQHHGKTSGHSL